MIQRNYETLDAIAVVMSLALVGGIIVGLFVFKIDDAVAPIISSLATAILGIPVSYGAFRWGNSLGAKQAADTAAKVSEAQAAALSQIAGAGPPPPAAPLSDEKDSK
jgi:xanthosine utilization system XapX-like protein